MRRFELYETIQAAMSIRYSELSLDYYNLKKLIESLEKLQDNLYFWEGEGLFNVVFKRLSLGDKSRHGFVYTVDLEKATICFESTFLPTVETSESREFFVEHLADCILSVQRRIDYLEEELESYEMPF